MSEGAKRSRCHLRDNEMVISAANAVQYLMNFLQCRAPLGLRLWMGRVGVIVASRSSDSARLVGRPLFLHDRERVTCCPARKLAPSAADMPSTAAGDTPADMHAALHPSLRTKALACA